MRSGAVLLLLLLLLCFFSYGTEARAWNTMTLAGSWKGIEAGSVVRFAAIKHSGPSPSGPGHRFEDNNGRRLVRIKDSVSGRGAGHK
ncbi:hypothetical protein TIFTF001_007081 [Ficus carica]|uniref:Uncharacterized protein n=1 Tax=Ficus carica TaxID=3494 RepID=A0AA87ZPA0_FICCA|nr:hypothetical protein TIFTF001_007081 [Ficus carica]